MSDNSQAWIKTATACLLILTGMLSGCASTRPAETSAPKIAANGLPASLQASRVEIAYRLGHVRRKLIAEATPEGVSASAYIGGDLLQGGQVKPELYARFYERVQEFVQQQSRAPASETENCQNPFRVELHADGEQKSVRGCRIQDTLTSSAISRLIREGEFLIHSKN